MLGFSVDVDRVSVWEHAVLCYFVVLLRCSAKLKNPDSCHELLHFVEDLWASDELRIHVGSFSLTVFRDWSQYTVAAVSSGRYTATIHHRHNLFFLIQRFSKGGFVCPLGVP